MTSPYITRCANGVSVADVARQALASATGFRFQNAKAFDTWWQGNKDYRHRLWYWAVRWATLPMAASPPRTAGGPQVPVLVFQARVSVEVDLPALVAALGPDEALKTLLLAANPGAVAAQAGANYTGNYDPNPHRKIPADAPVWLATNGPIIEPEAVARFVREQGLKPRLLEILRQDQPWPEVVAESSKLDLLHRVIEVLKILATPADAAALGQALLLRFRRDSTNPVLAAELIRTTGLKHWDLIAPAVRDIRVRSGILTPLGQLRTPQAARVLGGLLASEDFTPNLNRWGYETDPARQDLFAGYVQAAALLNGNRPVISEDLFNRARWRAWKISATNQEAMREEEHHNQGVPAARAEAVGNLKEFFDRAGR